MLPDCKPPYCEDCEGPCHHVLAPIKGIPGVKMTSPSRIFSGNVVGKKLTNRKIEEYRKMGRYGGYFPPVKETGPRCIDCGGGKKVKKCDYSYLPKFGHYCAHCLDKYRKSRDQEKKLAGLIRERRRSYL